MAIFLRFHGDYAPRQIIFKQRKAAYAQSPGNALLNRNAIFNHPAQSCMHTIHAFDG
jgi:hypothetical protein